MTSEAAVRIGVRRYLRRLKTDGKPIEFTSLHGTSYSTAGEPDMAGCFAGRMFLIELKAPGGKSTMIQKMRQNAWESVGALVLRDVTNWREVETRFKQEGLV